MGMKKITDMIKKYKQNAVKTIDRLPIPLYNVLCILLFAMMLLTLSQLSYSVRNLHYGSWECSTETGVITDKGHERIDYRTNHWREITLFRNYCRSVKKTDIKIWKKERITVFSGELCTSAAAGTENKPVL